MSENEIQRRYRLEAERKRAEQAGAPEVSMEELAARALAELSPATSQPPSATPAGPGKPSTMGVYGADDDKLIKDDTKAALENAGAMAAIAGRALMDKAREAAAVAQEKARLAMAKASAARAELAWAKDAREAQRREERSGQKAMLAIQDHEPAAVPRPEIAPNPAQPPWQGAAVEELPTAWTAKQPVKKKAWPLWLGMGLIVVAGSGAAWWLSSSSPFDPVPAPTPKVEATSPAAPLPAQPVEAVGTVVVPPVMEHLPASPAPVLEARAPKGKPDLVPTEVKPTVEAVLPKPVPPLEKPTPVVKKFAPQPSVKKVEPKDDWQDKGMQELDALEKQLGG